MHGKLDGKEFKMGTVQIGHMDCKSGVFNMKKKNRLLTRSNVDTCQLTLIKVQYSISRLVGFGLVE